MFRELFVLSLEVDAANATLGSQLDIWDPSQPESVSVDWVTEGVHNEMRRYFYQNISVECAHLTVIRALCIRLSKWDLRWIFWNS